MVLTLILLETQAESSMLYRLLTATLLFTTGCTGTWVWQEDYPKHRTMSMKCPRWNYDETYDRLHHAWTTKQHEPIKVKK